MKNSLLNKHLDKIKGVNTPFYFYDLELLESTVNAAVNAAGKYGYKLHYAFKANWNSTILEIMHRHGLGADCVSGNEIEQALLHGFNPQEIVFAGVGKTDNEILLGLEKGIFSFNCESLPELEVIDQLAKQQGKKANIALRINPNINAKTHHYITTGLEENKFGINPWEFDSAMDILRASENLELTGLHFHIGSQITEMGVYTDLCGRVNEINTYFAENGFVIPHLNLGGGLGVNYHEPNGEPIPDFETYFGLVNKFLTPFSYQEIHFEPGRCLVAQCGSLITRVLYVKKGLNTQFLILDGGMTELLRPALYQAFHKIENLSSTSLTTEFYDVVGPICESSDCFGKKVELPVSKRGDIVALRTAGAYGQTMASRYNMRDLPEEVYG